MSDSSEMSGMSEEEGAGDPGLGTERTWCDGCVEARTGHHHTGIVSYHEGGPFLCDCTLRISDEERAAYMAGASTAGADPT